MALAVIPLLVSGVAAAAPGYPVENPPNNPFTVSYDATSQVLTLDTSIGEESDGVVAGVDGTDADAATVVVVGPGGQVNHGQIVRRVNELSDGQLSGCITRTVAMSDLGKGDQQVTPNDPSTESDILEPIDLTILEGECSNVNGSDKSASTGAPDTSARNPDGSRGKSEGAPGTNK
jgi:hypothetical protein